MSDMLLSIRLKMVGWNTNSKTIEKYQTTTNKQPLTVVMMSAHATICI